MEDGSSGGNHEAPETVGDVVDTGSGASEGGDNGGNRSGAEILRPVVDPVGVGPVVGYVPHGRPTEVERRTEPTAVGIVEEDRRGAEG
jgi:hypothetical protein